jgi:hypothetical protein
MTSEAWHSRSADEALAHFGSSAAGLSAADASARLAANGPNQPTEGTRIGPLKILLGQFKSLLIWMITGDHPHTAIAVAREIGLASDDDLAVSGVELDTMSGEALRRAPDAPVYARVTAFTRPRRRCLPSSCGRSAPAVKASQSSVSPCSPTPTWSSWWPFDLQVSSQHNATLGRFLKTSSVPLADCVVLLAVGAIPLLILDTVKVARDARRQKTAG